ncbi:hypothetical protein HK104_005591, partial [Borealophlyctis nickersoniae]
DSASATTGALVVNGGWGIAKRLRVSTTITCTSLTQTSDRNLKKEIEPLSDKALQFILSLRPVSYKFKRNPKISKSMGLIAQDVETACLESSMPSELVKCENGTYGIQYAQLIAPLIRAVQQQNDLIELLSLKLERLERFNDYVLLEKKDGDPETYVTVYLNGLKDEVKRAVSLNSDNLNDLLSLKSAALRYDQVIKPSTPRQQPNALTAQQEKESDDASSPSALAAGGGRGGRGGGRGGGGRGRSGRGGAGGNGGGRDW